MNIFLDFSVPLCMICITTFLLYWICRISYFIIIGMINSPSDAPAPRHSGVEDLCIQAAENKGINFFNDDDEFPVVGDEDDEFPVVDDEDDEFAVVGDEDSNEDDASDNDDIDARDEQSDDSD